MSLFSMFIGFSFIGGVFVFSSYGAILCPRSKIISIFLLIVVWFLYWSCAWNADLVGYKNLYDSYRLLPMQKILSEKNFEKGFFFLMGIGSKSGLSYNAFLAIISGICYSLIYSTLDDCFEHIPLVLLLYLFSTFPIDVTQVRNFIAMSIIIYGLKVLLNKKFIQYIFIVFIATQFHTSSIFALLYVFILIENKSLIYSFAFIGIILGVVTWIFRDIITDFALNLIAIITKREDRYSGYLTNRTNYGHIYHWVFQVFQIIIIRRCIDEVKPDWKYYYIATQILKIDLLTVIFFPVFVYSNVISRVYRNLMILNYSVYVEFLYLFLSKHNKRKNLIYIYLGVAIVFGLSIQCESWDYVVFPVIINNYLVTGL